MDVIRGTQESLLQRKVNKHFFLQEKVCKESCEILEFIKNAQNSPPFYF